MAIQKQLDQRYHCDRYLRYSLLTAIDIENIAYSLKGRIHRNSKILINKVENRVSSKQKTAGSSFAKVASEVDPDLGEDGEEPMYKLGQTYDREARR